MAESAETEVKEIKVSTIGAIAIGFVESYSPEQMEMFIKFAQNMKNDGVVTELTETVTAIKEKNPLSERDIIALGFIILLAERAAPEGQDTKLDA